MTNPRVFQMPHRPGFTLLELLLASALTTMLMVGVLGLVSQIGLPAEESADAISRDAAVEGFAEMLRADLEHAVAVDATDENHVELLGYAALDDEARSRSHRPVRIVYRFDEIRGRSWLVREQHLLDVLTNRNMQRDLVAAGVSSFALDADVFRPAHNGQLERPAAGTGGAGRAAEDSDAATTDAGVTGTATAAETASAGEQAVVGEAAQKRTASSDRRTHFGAGPTHVPDNSDRRNFLRWRYQVEDKGKPGQAPDSRDAPSQDAVDDRGPDEADGHPTNASDSRADGGEASVGTGHTTRFNGSSDDSRGATSSTDAGGFASAGTLCVPGIGGDFVSVAGRVWRLRVWREQQGDAGGEPGNVRGGEQGNGFGSEPAAERIVSAQRGGG